MLLDSQEFYITHPNLSVFKGDVGDYDLLNKVFKDQNIDGVIHLAALKSVVESFAYPGHYLENNFVKSKMLFEKASSSQVKKFIFASSAAVYSDTEKGHRVTELSMCVPRSPYGKSKLLAS